MEYRVAHNKFQGHQTVGKAERFDRVVSSAWSLDPVSNILTYGATVFKKNGNTDHWNRRLHKQMAVERFQNNPVQVRLITSDDSPLKNISIDWFIARKLVYFFGTHNLSDETVHEVDIPYDFNWTYCLNGAYSFQNQHYCECSYPGVGISRNSLNVSWFILGACCTFIASAAYQYIS